MTYELRDPADYKEMLKQNASIRTAYHFFRDRYYVPILVINSLISFWSFGAIAKFYLRQGKESNTNIGIRKSMIRKQVLFYVLVNIFEIAHLANTLSMKFEQLKLFGGAFESLGRINGACFLIFELRVCILPLVRFLEPTLLKQAKYTVLYYFCCQSKALKKREKLSDEDPDIMFISSTQNNLLVCSILTGISLSFQGQSSEKDSIRIDFDKVSIPNPNMLKKAGIK